MRQKIKKGVRIGFIYLIAFIISAIVSSFMVNKGKISGSEQNSSAGLPVVYVKSGGRLMNEMHGYTIAVDGGYYRDTLTAVGSSRTINLVISDYNHHITNASFELYNDQFTELVESGECSEVTKADGGYQMMLKFQNQLQSNREYCLRLMLASDEENVINYYTRVRYGEELKVAEKLKFVLDFNEATFDKGSVSELYSYLESSSSTDSSDYSLVTLYSSADMVTWGSMEPYRTSDIAIRLKEINTETAAFTLDYTIESAVQDSNETRFYQVEEYYRIRIGEDKIYLLDFQRSMSENLMLSTMNVSKGEIRLGVGDQNELDYAGYGTETQGYVYFVKNDQLWCYDYTNRILTSVYNLQEDNHTCSSLEQRGIRVVQADDTNGDLYFIVYGYMHTGNYEGQQGVMIYHFSSEDVMLEQMMFIPFNKGFEQLQNGISKLAYMNDQGELFLMLDDSVYKINVELGRLELAWDHVSERHCVTSEGGRLVLTVDGNDFGGDKLQVINLENEKSNYIDGQGMLLMPYGFAGEDLVYGILDKQNIMSDSAGVMRAPAKKLLIADENLKASLQYEKEGLVILKVDIRTGNIALQLGRASSNGRYMDYMDAGDDYIVRNKKEDGSTVSLGVTKSSQYGMQNWLVLDTTDSFMPITQSARYLDPGYDITKEYDTQNQDDVRYYVYTKGILAAKFATIQEAIEYGNANAGTVMTSHKQIAWQRAGRAYIWELDTPVISKGDTLKQQKETIIQYILDYEGWKSKTTINGNQPVFAMMTEELQGEAVDLTGLALTDVLHFVYRDRIVVTKMGQDQFVLITGYNNSYIKIEDPQTGTEEWLEWSTVEKSIKDAGNIYYSYFD